MEELLYLPYISPISRLYLPYISPHQENELLTTVMDTEEEQKEEDVDSTPDDGETQPSPYPQP